jgi:predicted DsbA family dithiol-disulfide isomerase
LAKAIETMLSQPAVPNKPVAFAVLRVPFFLEPEYDENLPAVESNRERLEKKWGGKQGWEQQKNNHDLKGRGMEAGIPHFNLDRLAANSMASHRLIQYIGKTYGLAVSETVYDLLNEYYFVDGHSLNDRPRLARAVVQKLDELLQDQAPTETEILDFLNGNQGRAEIEKSFAKLHRLGIHSIPKFIIEGKTVVDGAARSSVFVKIFREIEKRGTVQGEPIFADILGVPPEIIQEASHKQEAA